MSKNQKALQDELADAKRAARENLRRNAGRDQAEYEHRVDVAEKAAKQARR